MALNPDGEYERSSAFAWLMEDPDHRAIESPTNLDAVLNMIAAREAYPSYGFTVEQFSNTLHPAATERVVRQLGLHLYIF
jgi:hypothetical protein